MNNIFVSISPTSFSGSYRYALLRMNEPKATGVVIINTILLCDRMDYLFFDQG